MMCLFFWMGFMKVENGSPEFASFAIFHDDDDVRTLTICISRSASRRAMRRWMEHVSGAGAHLAQNTSSAPENVVRELQELQRTGALHTRGGENAEPFEDGLLTADGAWLYPIRSGIPAMIAGEAIASGRGS